MFSGRGGEYDVGWVLEAISPYTWACSGIAAAMFLSVLGAAWLVWDFVAALVVEFFSLLFYFLVRFYTSFKIPRECWLSVSSAPVYYSYF